jgi:beta-lactamase class A
MELGSAMDLQSALMMEGIELSVHAEQLQWHDQEDLQEENRQAGDGALGDAGDEDGELNWHE